MPGDAVFDDVERLARNLVAMNGILRDRSHTSIRLVMNPERMVVKEAMRTFTYLNLYGYLTDAVVVNRVLPPERPRATSTAWREAPAGAAGAGALRVRAAADPDAPFFDREVVGAEMLDRLAESSSASATPPSVLHDELDAGAATDNGRATLRAAAAVRRARRDRSEEDRARGDRAGGRPEADDHAAARHVRLRHERRALRGRRAANLLREDRGCTRTG